jgi:hypothetical protein
LANSESITVTTDVTQSPPKITLNTRDTDYDTIYPILTRNLYNTNGNVPYTINVPENKNFLVHIINNDLTNLTLPNNQKLEIIFNTDLGFKQSVDIIIDADDTATQNKQLDIYINYKFGESTPVETRLLETIDLPIYYNTVTQLTNSAKTWKELNFDIDLNRPFRLNTGSVLEVPISSGSDLVFNSFKRGDTFVINDFLIGTSSRIDFSGQYPVSFVGNDGYIYFNVANNTSLITYGASQSLPLVFNATQSYLLSNIPRLKLNKGVKFKVTRISDSPTSELKERYFIQRQMY